MESIFPKINPVTPGVLCECIGSAITRVIQLGRVTEPCLSEHIREPQENVQETLDL